MRKAHGGPHFKERGGKKQEEEKEKKLGGGRVGKMICISVRC